MVPNEFWIVVSQWDVSPKGYHSYGPPRGPLVHEGYCATYEQAEARAKMIGDQYGWITIMKVVSEGGVQ